jgi:hypothetical protein
VKKLHIRSFPPTSVGRNLPHPLIPADARTPVSLQIKTVVETYRDLEVPPTPPSYEGRTNIQAGTVTDSEFRTD